MTELKSAKKDGVLRHHTLRRDGTVRDTVIYSMLAQEWPEAKEQLLRYGNPVRFFGLVIITIFIVVNFELFFDVFSR